MLWLNGLGLVTSNTFVGFLGLTSYYKWFIKRYGSIVSSLIKLIKKRISVGMRRLRRLLWP
jgi:hypothetical protein